MEHIYIVYNVYNAPTRIVRNVVIVYFLVF